MASLRKKKSKAPAARAVAKKPVARRSATRKRPTPNTPRERTSRQDPKGGLTAAGRRFFAEKEGAHLKPGVSGPADTPEKMKRKGSFLRRHFANLRGPLLNAQGEPTRLALSAHAWGESVPRTKAAAERLAKKGTRLLERYARALQSSRRASSSKQVTRGS